MQTYKETFVRDNGQIVEVFFDAGGNKTYSFELSVQESRKLLAALLIVHTGVGDPDKHKVTYSE